jgi:hypothetical protein
MPMLEVVVWTCRSPVTKRDGAARCRFLSGVFLDLVLRASIYIGWAGFNLVLRVILPDYAHPSLLDLSIGKDSVADRTFLLTPNPEEPKVVKT